MSASSHVSRRTRSALLALLLLGSLVAGAMAGVLPGSGASAGAAVATTKLQPSGSIDRVLIISIPHVGWADLQHAHAPNLKRLLRRSAVANLTARSGGGGPVAGYLTLGAGKRSLGTNTPSDGMGFGVDERFGDDTAGAAFARRTGIDRASGLVQLGIVGLQSVNDAEPGGSSIGALGTSLRGAGYRTAVIGNSDGSVPDDGLDRYRRYLVTGLMSKAGTVDGGQVDRKLLVPDASAPFGLRLDNDAVLAAFQAAWTPKSVVMVEGSDIVRAIDSRTPAVASQDVKSYETAIANTDELVGKLLGEVDPAHDAVIVVGPYPSRVTRGLTVVGVRAPGITPGLMKSASTRRAGFVLLADVAPSVLQLLDIPRPKSMNGRPFTIGSTAGSAHHRVKHMIDETKAALFRDRVLRPVTYLATVMAGLVAIAGVLVWELRRRGPWRGFARFGSSWLLGLVAAVYLARLFPFQSSGVFLYYLFLAGFGLVAAVLYELLGAGDPTGPTMFGLAAIWGLLVVDVLTGARLQLSTAFGYTPSIGIRFAGVGNVAYAFLGAAAVLLAGLLAHRIGGRRGAWVAVAVMFVALVVDAAPMLGGDVGGLLSLTPAFLVTGLLLFGIRIRVRTVVWLVVAAALALAAAAAIDLARPARDQTHLGRLLSNARERGLSEITGVISRKLSHNLDTWSTSDWRVMFVIGVLFVGYLAWRGRARVGALVNQVPELRAALIGFAVLAVLGYAVNDSGVAIPAVMLYVLVAALVGMLVRAGGAPGAGASPDDPTGASSDAAADDQVSPTADESTDSVREATPSH